MKKKYYTSPKISVYIMPELCQMPEVSRSETNSSTDKTPTGPDVSRDDGTGEDSGKDHQGGLWNF